MTVTHPVPEPGDLIVIDENESSFYIFRKLFFDTYESMSCFSSVIEGCLSEERKRIGIVVSQPFGENGGHRPMFVVWPSVIGWSWHKDPASDWTLKIDRRLA